MRAAYTPQHNLIDKKERWLRNSQEGRRSREQKLKNKFYEQARGKRSIKISKAFQPAP